MTSFAFIFGVLPLLISEGAGAECVCVGHYGIQRHVGGDAVRIFFTPVFYWVIRGLTERRVRTVIQNMPQTPHV